MKRKDDIPLTTSVSVPVKNDHRLADIFFGGSNLLINKRKKTGSKNQIINKVRCILCYRPSKHFFSAGSIGLGYPFPLIFLNSDRSFSRLPLTFPLYLLFSKLDPSSDGSIKINFVHFLLIVFAISLKLPHLIHLL